MRIPKGDILSHLRGYRYMWYLVFQRYHMHSREPSVTTPYALLLSGGSIHARDNTYYQLCAYRRADVLGRRTCPTQISRLFHFQ